MIMHIPAADMETVSDHLDRALDALVRRLPEPIRRDVDSLHEAGSEEMFQEALNNLRNSVIDWSRASERTQSHFYATTYCDCILCGENVASKAGIEKHLARYNGGCDVYAAILFRAEQAYAATSARQADIERATQARVDRETSRVLVDLSRGTEPALSGYGQRRNDPEMSQAEERLYGLGFEKVEETQKGATVVRWEMFVEGAYVLADARWARQLSFHAWHIDTLKRYEQGRRVYSSQPFCLHDSWHKELRKKLMLRIEASLELPDGALEAHYADLPPAPEPEDDEQAIADIAPPPVASSSVDVDEPEPYGAQRFEAMTHSQVLAQARSMSRKDLIERYGLSPGRASRRINAAIDWEKSTSGQ